MRKSFAQVLREGNVDIRQEYRKLYSILHQEAFDHRTKSLYEVFGENFAHFYFRGTCLSIEEFDQNMASILKQSQMILILIIWFHFVNICKICSSAYKRRTSQEDMAALHLWK